MSLINDKADNTVQMSSLYDIAGTVVRRPRRPASAWPPAIAVLSRQ
jgi:hypothetical protein